MSGTHERGSLGHMTGDEALETLATGAEEEGEEFVFSDASSAELDPGATVGRYVVLERIGAGAMGIVYAAYDPELDRRIALKVLRGGARGRFTKTGRARLLREAQSIARLSHPNVVAIHDVGTTADDAVFIGMEYVEGETLTTWQSAEGRTWQETLEVYLQAGRGLAAAHAVGLVHRDFKPDNVLVGKDGRARVLDFGIARAQQGHSSTGGSLREHAALISDSISTSQRGLSEEVDLEPTPADAPVERTVADESLTRTGALVGTPAYMSPEQHLSQPTDPRSDQFSFCIALYEGLWGRRPFDGESHATLALQVTQGNVREPSGGPVPGSVRRSILRGLKVDPDLRWPDMSALLRELEPKQGSPRTRLVLLGALAVVTTALAASLWTRDEEPTVCEGLEVRLGNTWDGARKQAMQARFDSTSAPFATEAFTAASGNLDRYASEWSAMRKEACEATHLRGDQSAALLDLRMACLDRRRAEMGALVEQLLVADIDTVQHAPAATESLIPVAGCGDAEALSALVPPPEDPAVRAEVESVREKIAESDALLVSGKPDEGKAAAQEALAAAKKVMWGPIHGEAALALAEAELARSDLRAAKPVLREALLRAEAAGDPHTELRTWIAFVNLYGEQEARVDRAHEAAGHVEALFERLGTIKELEADYLAYLASTYDWEGRYDEALASLDRAQTIVEDIHGPRSIEASEVHAARGNVYYDLTDYDNARASFEEALAISREIHGDAHPNSAHLLSDVGIVEDDLGNYEESAEYFERALEIVEAAHGPDTESAGVFHNNLGSSAHAQGRLEDAEREFQKAKEIFEAHKGADHPDVAMTLGNLALVAEGRGDLDSALRLNEEALEIYRRRFGDEHRVVAWVMHSRAGVLHLLERTEEALIEHRRALEINMRTLGPEHIAVSDGHEYIGDVLYDQERWEEALTNYERAAQIRQGRLPETHPAVGFGYAVIGETLLELGRHEEAIVQLERGIRALETTDIADENLPGFRFVLARALEIRTPGDERARALATEAHEAIAEDEDQAELLAEIRAWQRKHR